MKKSLPIVALLLPAFFLPACAARTRTAPPATLAPASTEPAKPRQTGLIADTVNATKSAGDATWAAVTSPAKLFRKKPAPTQPAASTEPAGPPDLILLSPQDDTGNRPVLVAPAGR